MQKNISLELLLSNEVFRLLDSFATVMKIQAVFFSKDGKILKRGRDVGNCDYCQRVQQKYFGVKKCEAFDQEKQKICREKGKIICYKCHAELHEMIAPVKIFGHVAGFIMVGQFRSTNSTPEFIQDDKKAQEEFFALPYFAVEDIGSLEDMFKVLIDYIVNKELVSYNESLRYQKLIHYIDLHLSENITLKKLARYLNISESSLTHFLQNEYKTSFKKILIDKRLSAAEDLWRKDLSLTISEVAFRVGYEDYHYFSRLYHRERGITPGTFKQNFLNM